MVVLMQRVRKNRLTDYHGSSPDGSAQEHDIVVNSGVAGGGGLIPRWSDRSWS